jgi:hypothetical protein
MGVSYFAVRVGGVIDRIRDRDRTTTTFFSCPCPRTYCYSLLVSGIYNIYTYYVYACFTMRDWYIYIYIMCMHALQ